MEPDNTLPAHTLYLLAEKFQDFDSREIHQGLQAHFGEALSSVQFDEKSSNRFIVSIINRDYLVFWVESPLPRDALSFENQNNTQLLEFAFSKHKAHVVIRPFSASVESLEGSLRSATELSVLGRILAQVFDNTAACWGRSKSTMLPKELFRFTETLSGILAHQSQLNSTAKPEKLSLSELHFWIGFDLYTIKDKGLVAIRTRGFDAFTGFELQIDYLNESRKILIESVYEVISYSFTTGKLLRPGERTSIGSHEFEISEIPGNRQYCRALMLKKVKA